MFPLIAEGQRSATSQAMYQLFGLFVTLTFASVGGGVGGEWSWLGVGYWQECLGGQRQRKGFSGGKAIGTHPPDIYLPGYLLSTYFVPGVGWGCRVQG